MRGQVFGWRWRSNPLRRRSDVVEAWTVLLVVFLLVVAAPAAGLAVGRWAHGDARAHAAAERAALDLVGAVVVEDAPDAVPTVHGDKQPLHWVQARWTEPDGGSRTGEARVPAGTERGDRADVWLDSAGRSVQAPPTDTAVWQHALAMGTCATGGVVGLVLLGHFAVRRVATRHRLAEWEREWARTGPDWGHRWA
ncbi:Rv1733c family protein [Streptomyces sp. NPDC002787]